MTTTTLQAAQGYHARGWQPVPVPHRGKECLVLGWPDLRLSETDLPRHFGNVQTNLGVILGAASGGLSDVDLDCPQARALGPYFLPPTGAIFGRKSSPGSHWLYTCGPAAEHTEYADPADGAMLLELRSDRHQTVFPPSCHETGEAIRWEPGRDGDPAAVDGTELRSAGGKLAAATLLARHWPDRGSRQQAAMALSGGLLRAGWQEEATAHFVGHVARAAGDEETLRRARAAEYTAAALRELGGKATGWPRLAELLGDQAVRKTREWLGLDGRIQIGRDRDFILRHQPWPEDLAPEALCGLAGDFVRALEPHTEAHPVALLAQFLAGFGNLVGRSAYFSAEADQHFANLFVALVGPTAKGRKGTAWGRVRSALEAVDPYWAQARVSSGLSSGEGLLWHVRDPIEKEKHNKDGTAETIVVDEGVADKRLLCLEPELASVLRVINRDGNTLSAQMRQAWDSGTLNSLVKNSPAHSTGAHVSVIGHITADELRRYLDRTEVGNGFANRFLWACVRRSKELPEGGGVPDWGDIPERLREAAASARQPRELKRDAEAREVWREVYHELSQGQPGLLGAVTSRAEAQTMRLALLYALLDCSPVIRAEHLAAGLALWEYAADSARHVFGNSLGDPVADELLRALRNTPQGMTREQIRDFFGRNRSSAELSRALGVLLEQDLARYERRETGGRPAEVWHAK